MLENCTIILFLYACEFNVNDSFLLRRNVFRDILFDLYRNMVYKLLIKNDITITTKEHLGYLHGEA